jgi:hypothetical protein
VIDESALAVGSPSIAGKAAILADNPVAGDNHRYWVCRTGAGYRAYRCGLANGAGYLRVRSRRSVWNATQFLPYAPLECGGLDVRRHIQARFPSTQVIENRFDPSAQILRVRLVTR